MSEDEDKPWYVIPDPDDSSLWKYVKPGEDGYPVKHGIKATPNGDKPMVAKAFQFGEFQVGPAHVIPQGTVNISSPVSPPLAKTPLIDYFITRFDNAVSSAAKYQDTHGFCEQDKEHYDRMVKNGGRIKDWLVDRLRARHDPQAAVEIVDVLAKALLRQAFPITWKKHWDKNAELTKNYRTRAKDLLKDPSLLILKGDL